MGKELYCDLCRATIAIDAGLKPILIGDSKICEVCLTCASRLEQGFKKQVSDAEAAVIMAKRAAMAPKEPPKAPEQSGPTVLSTEDIKKKIYGDD
jgi:hypothetical protein